MRNLLDTSLWWVALSPKKPSARVRLDVLNTTVCGDPRHSTGEANGGPKRAFAAHARPDRIFLDLGPPKFIFVLTGGTSLAPPSTALSFLSLDRRGMSHG